MCIHNPDRAIIPTAKLSNYLLNSEHPDGRDKAVVFLGMGFTPAALEEALRWHVTTYEGTFAGENEYGVKYKVEGAIITPSGRSLNIRSIWLYKRGTDIPRFITAVPLKP